MPENHEPHDELVLVEGFLAPLTNRPLVISVVVLDRSGSMKPYGQAPVQAVEEYLDVLRADTTAEYFACVVTFANTAEVAIPLAPIAEIDGSMNYQADGHTLLWRTVKRVLGEMIRKYNESEPELRSRLRVVVGVISDGDDNQSPPELYPSALRMQSAVALDCGFTLQAFGIGIDSQVLAHQMGFPSDLAQSHEGTAQGVRGSVLNFSSTTINTARAAAAACGQSGRRWSQ